MDYIQDMILINIHDAKARLSEYLEAARNGERVLICRHNKPVAELRALEESRAEPRDLTPMYPGATLTTAAFFEPLPQAELEAWEGLAHSTGLRAAERRASHSATRRRPAGTRRGRR